MAYSTTEGPHRKEGGAFHISGPTSQETPDASVAWCLAWFLCIRCEFRQARSRTPLPDGVLTVVGMTDGVWQGGSVTRILL